jgi:hypothetical protein
VNGVETPADVVNRLDAKNILSVDVRKGAAAAAYGPRGKNGVVLISTAETSAGR